MEYLGVMAWAAAFQWIEDKHGPGDLVEVGLQNYIIYNYLYLSIIIYRSSWAATRCGWGRPASSWWMCPTEQQSAWTRYAGCGEGKIVEKNILWPQIY